MRLQNVYAIYMTVVPVRLSEDEIRKLNLLMRRGVYRSRNEAIRTILAEGLQEKLGEDEDVTSLVNRLISLSREGKTPISFKSSRRVVEIVSEGRM